MDDSDFHVPKPPIVEAIVDFDCDVQPTFDLAALETVAKERYGDRYPNAQKQTFYEQQLMVKPGDQTSMSTRQGLQALRFIAADGKELVQIRGGGFSFNRLAPYGRLADYLPEVERTWRLYADLAKPIQLRAVRLRYINRILLPFQGGEVTLENYLNVQPVPKDSRLTFAGFVTQHVAIDTATRAQVQVSLVAQRAADGKLPLILDISVQHAADSDPEDWAGVAGNITMLRGLKNHVFRSMLTERCLNLFR